MIQDALGLLARSSGLVVNLSSDAAVGGYPGWGGYGASKAALDLLSLTLAGELREQQVAVVSASIRATCARRCQDAFPGESIDDRPLPENHAAILGVAARAWGADGRERATASGPI